MADYFYDENYWTLLRAVRSKPKTVDEIVDFYESEGNPKSLMTVYRYIRELIKADLLVEAGKRIITDEENRNKTLTLYCTTAQLYYDAAVREKKFHEKHSIRSRELEIYCMLLKMLTGKEASRDCVNSVIDSVYEKGRKHITKIMEESEKDLNKYLADFGLMMTNTLIVHIGWMSLILDEEIRKKILECTET